MCSHPSRGEAWQGAEGTVLSAGRMEQQMSAVVGKAVGELGMPGWVQRADRSARGCTCFMSGYRQPPVDTARLRLAGLQEREQSPLVCTE